MNPQLFEKIIHSLPLGYAYHRIIKDTDGRPVNYVFLDVNENFEKFTGLKREKILNQKVTEVIPGIENDDFDWIGYYGEVALNGGEKELEQFSSVLNKWYRIKILSPEKDHFATYFFDITAEKMISKTSKEFLSSPGGEFHYQAICDNLLTVSGAKYIAFNEYEEGEGVFVTRALTGGNSNLHKAADLLGFHPLGKKWNVTPVKNLNTEGSPVKRFKSLSRLSHGVMSRAAISGIEKFFQIGEVVIVKVIAENKVFGDFTLLMPQGGSMKNELAVEIYARQVGHFLIRSRAQRTIVKTKERLELAMEAGEHGFWDWDIETGEVYFSPRYETMLGYEPGELSSCFETWEALLHPDDRKITVDQIKDHVAKLEPFAVDFRILCKDGSYRWISGRGKSYEKDRVGIPKRALGVHVDITGQKEMTERLKERDILLSKLTNQVPGALYQYRLEPDGRSFFPFAGKGIYHVYEVSPQEVCHDAKKVFDRIHPDDLVRVRDSIFKSSEDLTIWDEAYRVILPEKGLRWLSGVARPERVEGGATLWHGYITDITERKQTEDELLKTREQYMLAVRGSKDGIWDWDITNHKLFLSPRWKEMLGYRDDELKNEFDSFINRVLDEDRDELLLYVDKYLKGEIQEYNTEFRMKHKNGHAVWILARGEAIRDENGTACRMAGSHSDITLQKEMEEKLIESEKRFRYALTGSNEGLWDWNIKSGEVFFSFKWCDMLGYLPEEISPRIESWKTLLHPDDRISAEKKIQDHFEGKTEYYQDAQRLKKKDGSWLWILDKGKVVEKDKNGKPLRMVGTHTDIHHRRQLEERVRQDLEEKKDYIAKAQKLQKHLNTRRLPALAEILVSAFYIPSDDLSGDFFYVYDSPERRRVIFFLGDCTGHGIKASMDATLLKSICDRHLRVLEDQAAPDLFLSYVNKDLTAYDISEKYPTLFAGVLNIDDKTLYYANANAPLPYVVDKKGDGTFSRLPAASGFFLGFDKDSSYERRKFFLEDKKLILYSDSIYEFETVRGGIFSRASLETLLKKIGGTGYHYLEKLIKEVKKEAVRFPLEDDLTLITFEVKKPYVRRFLAKTEEDIKGYSYEFEKILKEFGFCGDSICSFSIVFYELGLNAVVHGNKRDPQKTVTIEVTVHYNLAEFTLTDEGSGFAVSEVPDPGDYDELLRQLENNETDKYTHGRGVWLSRRYADAVEYNEKGNSVKVLKKSCPREVRYFEDEG